MIQAPPAWPRGLGEPLAAQYVGLSQSQFGLMWRRGDAPQPVKLTVRRQVWLREDLDHWLDEKAGRARDIGAPATTDHGAALWEAALDGHG